MTAHQPGLPAKAIGLVESKNLDGSATLFADFACLRQGLSRTYMIDSDSEDAACGTMDAGRGVAPRRG